MFQNKYICSLIQSFLFLVACAYGVHKFTHVQRSEDLRYLPWSPPYFSDRVSHWNPKLADSASQAGWNCHESSHLCLPSIGLQACALGTELRFPSLLPTQLLRQPQSHTFTPHFTQDTSGNEPPTTHHPPTHIFSAARLSLDIIKKCQHKS